MEIQALGRQIAALRKEKGAKQEELARYVGVSTQAVSKWENGGLPDTELLPKIADFFSVSIDTLFERETPDNGELQAALIKRIQETPRKEHFRRVFNFCWDMERAMMPHGHFIDIGSVEEYQKEIGKTDVEHYSSMQQNEGFTHMGIGNRLQYFLIVPEPKDTDTALFNGIDYPALFRDLSDKAIFDACILLHSRDHKKAFTPDLLIQKLGIDREKADGILAVLSKYHMVCTSQIEINDGLQTVYNFKPTPSFFAMLIFAREIIDRPNTFSYFCSNRNKPYFN
ncbi:MAG: helix-turn-helix transcriptional regulator [Clostridia bacterium]|nr:helix-turn-helix transcriptional regulator [Clostridia bacterium]